MLNKRILVLMFLLLFLPLVGCFPPPTNQAPILTSDPITTTTVGIEYVYDVDATDPDGDTLVYSLVVKPTNMTINSATGLIKWTPVTIQVGDNSVTVKVSDGSLSITQSFTIKVKAVNHAPSINSIPVTTATVGVTYFYVVNATDPDGDTLTYSLTTYPSNMTINSATGVISWIPTLAQVGNNLVTVMVSDGVLYITQSFTIKVSTLPPVNQAPVIYSIPITTATSGISYTYDVDAIDPDGDILAYYLTTCPSGMTIALSTGKITWIPESAESYVVTVKVSDGELSDTQGFTITVTAGALEHFTITGYPTEVVAGASFSTPANDVVITAYDANNNIKTDYTGEVYFTSTDGAAVLPYISGSRYTFTGTGLDDGVHNFAGSGFTLNTTGTQTITLTDGTYPVESGNIEVKPGALASFTIDVPLTVTTLVPFDVTVTAFDVCDNIKTDYVGIVTFISTDVDGLVVLPGPYTFAPADNGACTFTGGFTLVTIPGPWTITVTDAIAVISVISDSITVN